MNVLAFLDGVAGATNDTFRLVGSPMQQEAREARAAMAELIEKSAAILNASPATLTAHKKELRAALARVQGA